MKFYSTNNSTLESSFRESIMQGMPEDNGLYMPSFIPDISNIIVQDNRLTFKEISYIIASEFIGDELSKSDIHDIIENSITFEAPNQKIYNNTFCLELFHGPTLAFKDFGARFMARCMEKFIEFSNKEINILVATSGDTGSAVANGFYNVKGINVIILYPKGKVSEIQEKQLTTLDKNIYALEVDGTFDDCQKLVKAAFLDKSLKNSIKLSSANSINIARLIPQSFYYVHSFLQLKNKDIPLIFSVPCGNFGNITAGLIAKKMGVPIHKFIASTNLNDVIPNYLLSGNYIPKPSIQTISNAMDVGDPSNIVRINELYKDIDAIRNVMKSWSFDEQSTKKMILDTYKNYAYLLDPHSSVGLLGIKKYFKNSIDDNVNKIFLGTAHPCKFLDVIEPVIDGEIKIPDRLKETLLKQKKSVLINNNYNQFIDYLMTTFQ